MEGQSVVARALQNRKDKLDTDIKQYRTIPCLDEDSHFRVLCSAHLALPHTLHGEHTMLKTSFDLRS